MRVVEEIRGYSVIEAAGSERAPLKLSEEPTEGAGKVRVRCRGDLEMSVAERGRVGRGGAEIGEFWKRKKRRSRRDGIGDGICNYRGLGILKGALQTIPHARK